MWQTISGRQGLESWGMKSVISWALSYAWFAISKCVYRYVLIIQYWENSTPFSCDLAKSSRLCTPFSSWLSVSCDKSNCSTITNPTRCRAPKWLQQICFWQNWRNVLIVWFCSNRYLSQVQVEWVRHGFERSFNLTWCKDTQGLPLSRSFVSRNPLAFSA